MSWEDICLRCGLCCHEKVIKDDSLIILDESCEFYDKDTGLCKVYSQRFKKCPRCMKVSPFRAAFSPYLPPTCAYVAWAYRHHVRFARKREMLISSNLLPR